MPASQSSCVAEGVLPLARGPDNGVEGGKQGATGKLLFRNVNFTATGVRAGGSRAEITGEAALHSTQPGTERTQEVSEKETKGSLRAAFTWVELDQLLRSLGCCHGLVTFSHCNFVFLWTKHSHALADSAIPISAQKPSLTQSLARSQRDPPSHPPHSFSPSRCSYSYLRLSPPPPPPVNRKQPSCSSELC